MYHTEEIINQDLEQHIKVTISATQIDQKFQDKVLEIKSTINFKGFRKGKVPESIILKQFGNNIYEEIVNDAVKYAAEDISKSKILSNNAIVDDLVKNKKQDVTFVLKLELYPEISIPNFTDIELEKPEIEVTQEDIEGEMKQVIEGATIYSLKEGSADLQDVIELSLSGKTSDGEDFPAQKIEKCVYAPSKDPFFFYDIEGKDLLSQALKGQIVGKNAGDEFMISIDYPQDIENPIVSGKRVDFQIKILAVCTVEIPEVDDNLAKTVGHENLDSLKEEIIAKLASFFSDQVYDLLKIKLFNKLENVLNFHLPKSMLEREVQSILAEIKNIARQDKSLEGKTQEDLKEHAERYAARRLRIGMMLDHYAKINNIKVSESEMRHSVIKKVSSMPAHLQQKALQWINNNKRAADSIFGEVFEHKVVEYILNNEIKTTPVKCSFAEVTKLIDAEMENNILI
jgi:trigger factor